MGSDGECEARSGEVRTDERSRKGNGVAVGLIVDNVGLSAVQKANVDSLVAIPPAAYVRPGPPSSSRGTESRDR